MNKPNWNNLEEEFLYYASLMIEKEHIEGFLKMIASGKIAIDKIKILREYSKEINNVEKREEFIRMVTDLYLEFAEIKDILAKQARETSVLKKRIINFEKENKKLKNSELQLTLKDGLYYKADNNDGPFCTACYYSNKKVTRLRTLPPVMKELRKHQCLVCNTVYL